MNDNLMSSDDPTTAILPEIAVPGCAACAQESAAPSRADYLLPGPLNDPLAGADAEHGGRYAKPCGPNCKAT